MLAGQTANLRADHRQDGRAIDPIESMYAEMPPWEWYSLLVEGATSYDSAKRFIEAILICFSNATLQLLRTTSSVALSLTYRHALHVLHQMPCSIDQDFAAHFCVASAVQLVYEQPSVPERFESFLDTWKAITVYYCTTDLLYSVWDDLQCSELEGLRFQDSTSP